MARPLKLLDDVVVLCKADHPIKPPRYRKSLLSVLPSADMTMLGELLSHVFPSRALRPLIARLEQARGHETIDRDAPAKMTRDMRRTRLTVIQMSKSLTSCLTSHCLMSRSSRVSRLMSHTHPNFATLPNIDDYFRYSEIRRRL